MDPHRPVTRYFGSGSFTQLPLPEHCSRCSEEVDPLGDHVHVVEHPGAVHSVWCSLCWLTLLSAALAGLKAFGLPDHP